MVGLFPMKIKSSTWLACYHYFFELIKHGWPESLSMYSDRSLDFHGWPESLDYDLNTWTLSIDDEHIQKLSRLVTSHLTSVI